MNIKRFFALLIVVVAVVTAFAACDGESKPTGTQDSNESNLESESISSESTSDTQQSTESETQAPEDLVDYKLVEQSGVHYIAFDNSNAYQFSQEPKLVENYSLDNIFERQEPLYYEDLIQNNYIDEKSPTTELDDYLIKTRSFLVIKVVDN